jgi:hypothetical protein
VTQTRIVLELWREAERVLEELGPVASSSDRAAMEADIEEIRVLYQRIQEQHAQDGQAEAAGPETGTQGPPIGVAIELVRQRHLETLRRLRPDLHDGSSAPTAAAG